MKKAATITDIAKITGVSTTTVYKVLHNKKGVSEKKRDEILQVARQMNYTSNVVAQTLARKELNIHAIIEASNREFMQKVVQGMRWEADALKNYRVNLMINNIDDNIDYRLDKDKTLKAFENTLDQKPDGVILYPAIPYREYNDFNTIIEERGIPVMTINNTLPGFHSISCVQYDGRVLGMLAGDLMNLCNPNGVNAVFIGKRDVPNQADTITGFEESIRKSSSQVIVTYENHYDDTIGSLLTNKLIDEYPEVNGIFIGISQSHAIINTLEERDMLDKYRIITVDTLDENLKLLSEDRLVALLDRHPQMIGRVAVNHLFKHLVSSIELESDILIPPAIILPSIAEGYSQKDLI